MRRRTWAEGLGSMVVALIVVAAAGCSLGQSGQGGHSPSPRSQSAAPTLPPSATQLATWQKCGATQVPPADVLRMPAQLPKVINRTNGAISDADAQKWVAAYMREQFIELWAITHDEEGLLRGSCLGSQTSTLQLFGDYLNFMQVARSSNRKIDVQLASYVSAAVVAVPPEVNTKIKGFDGTPSDYGLVVEIQGPGGTYYVDTSGNRSAAAVIKPTDHFWVHVGGTYKDSSAGPIWLLGSDFSCATQWLRATCGI